MKRRTFLQDTGLAVAGGFIVPTIVPNTVFGTTAPSNRINIGMMGFGRQAYHSNTKPFLSYDDVVITSVCDVDSWRMNKGKEMIESYYAKNAPNGRYKGCKMYKDFRDMIEDKSIDAVMISSTDHWHVPMSLLSVKAGKDVCCEKPLTLSIEEGRLLADAVKEHKRVFRTDSEFRSIEGFHRMAELVRNGRVGKIQTIYVGVPKSDVTKEQQPTMPVPSELDYEMWCGPVDKEPYTLHRVHEPQNFNSRPGWMRVRNTSEGLITNWGTHLNDIAQWCNGTDRTGPVEVEATGVYPPQENLWNVLLEMSATYKYADGTKLFYTMDRAYVKVIGDEGWIEYDYGKQALTASSDAILKSVIKETEIRFPLKHEKRDFIDAIKTRGETLEDAEVGHRTCSMCQIAHISIQLGGKKLKWDPDKELFDIREANVLKRRPSWRAPWTLESFL